MAFDPAERVPLGRTGLSATRLGFGAASIAGVFDVVAERDGPATLDCAWDPGVRYFDVAPLYGYGTGERRLGRSLAAHPRDEFVVSTKVGRLVRRVEEIAPDADVDRNAFGDRRDADRTEETGFRAVFDYSRDGILRSVEESLQRLCSRRPSKRFSAPLGPRPLSSVQVRATRSSARRRFACTASTGRADGPIFPSRMRMDPNALDPAHDRGTPVRERPEARPGSSVIAANLMHQPHTAAPGGRSEPGPDIGRSVDS